MTLVWLVEFLGYSQSEVFRNTTESYLWWVFVQAAKLGPFNAWSCAQGQKVYIQGHRFHFWQKQHTICVLILHQPGWTWLQIIGHVQPDDQVCFKTCVIIRLLKFLYQYKTVKASVYLATERIARNKKRRPIWTYCVLLFNKQNK